MARIYIIDMISSSLRVSWIVDGIMLTINGATGTDMLQKYTRYHESRMKLCTVKREQPCGVGALVTKRVSKLVCTVMWP